MRLKHWRKHIPWLDCATALDQIRDLTSKIAADPDYRSRQKLAHQLAFAATRIAASETDCDISALDARIAALRTARGCGATNEDLERAAVNLVKRRLDQHGISDAPILAEKSKLVNVEGGCLVAARASIGSEYLSASMSDHIAAMNLGRHFLINRDGDGRYRLKLRLIEAPEPLLKPTEYRKLNCATEAGYPAPGHGRLFFGAAEQPGRGATLACPTGPLKVYRFQHPIPASRDLGACRLQQRCSAGATVPRTHAQFVKRAFFSADLALMP